MHVALPKRAPKGKTKRRNLTKEEKTAARKRREEQRKHELQGALRMEIATAVGRSKGPRGPSTLVPFGKEPAWLPTVMQKAKNGNWKKARKPTPNAAFFKMLELYQGRIADVGNVMVAEMWTQMQMSKIEKGVPSVDAYKILRRMWHNTDVPQIASQTASGMARKIYQACARFWGNSPKKYKTRNKVVEIKDDWPIWIRADAWRFKRDDGFNLAFDLDGTWWEIGLRAPRKRGKKPADPYVFSTLRKIAAGENKRNKPDEKPDSIHWIPTTLGLQKRKGKWFALISHRYPKPPEMAVPNKMVVHCGIKNFAVAMDLQGALKRAGGLWIEGDVLFDQKWRFRYRRRMIQQARKVRRHGHGHQAQIDILESREKDWVDTWVKRVAATVVARARRFKCAIYCMDTTDIRKDAEASDLPEHVRKAVHRAPWYKLRQAIEHAAAKAGIPFKPYTPFFHTKRCPRCGTSSDSYPNYKTMRFACTNCGHEGHLDRIGVENAFVDLGHQKEITLPPSSDYVKAIRRIEELREVAKLTGLDKRERSSDGGKRRKKNNRFRRGRGRHD